MRMTTLTQSIQLALAPLSDVSRIWVAYSGGVDSTCLLHVIARQDWGVPVSAIHVNHQLSENASHWQTHCEAVAHNLAVPLVVEQVVVKTQQHGLEAAARQARYTAFAKHLGPGDVLMCAHHAQDQEETFWLRVLRGAGGAGLSAMAPYQVRGHYHLLRPWLAIDKADLLAYANQHSLTWVEDESNYQSAFDRNYLRLKVLPSVAQRWPNSAQKAGASAGLLAQEQCLLRQYAEEDLEKLKPSLARLGHCIESDFLKRWPKARSLHVLRHWLARHLPMAATAAQLEQIYAQLWAKEDQQPLVQIGLIHIRRYKDRLYCLPASTVEPEQEACLEVTTGAEVYAIPGGGQLRFRETGIGLKPGRYQVRFRSGPERCSPYGREHSQTLKKLLQEVALEPWLRHRVPLLFDGEKLAAVGDLWVEKSHCVQHGGYSVRWEFV